MTILSNLEHNYNLGWNKQHKFKVMSNLPRGEPLQSQWGYLDLCCLSWWHKSDQLGTALGHLRMGLGSSTSDPSATFHSLHTCPQSHSLPTLRFLKSPLGGGRKAEVQLPGSCHCVGAKALSWTHNHLQQPPRGSEKSAPASAVLFKLQRHRWS